MSTRDQSTGHSAQLHETPAEQLDGAARFVEDGLGANAKCVYVVNDHSRDEVLAALRDAGLDVDRALETNDLVVRPSDAVFPSGGTIRAGELVDTFASTIEDATDCDYDHVRVVGEMGWLNDHGIDQVTAVAFEWGVNAFCSEQPVRTLCQYDRNEFSNGFLADVLQAHPSLAYDTDEHTIDYDDCVDRPPATPRSGVAGQADEPTPNRSGVSQYLEALNDASTELPQTDPPELWGCLVDTAADALDAPHVSAWTVDEELSPQSSRSTLERPFNVSDALSALVWEVLGTTQSCGFDADSAVVGDRGTTLSNGAVVPVKSAGVLVVARETADLSSTELEFLEALASNAGAALENYEHRQSLQDHHEKLSARGDRLERLRRISRAFRGVSRAVVDGSTRSDHLESLVGHLADINSVEFAWVGAFDASTIAADSAYVAGDHDGYLEAVTDVEDWTAREPAGRAAECDETTKVLDVQTDPPLNDWRKHAIKRGARSVISLPITYQGYRYGVLSVYSNAPGTFDDEVTTVLEELSTLVAHGISAVDRRSALLSEDVYELELLVQDDDNPIIQMAEHADCRLDLEGISGGANTPVRFFVRVWDASLDLLTDVATGSKAIETIERLPDDNDGDRYVASLTEHSLTATLLDHGAVPTDITAADGEARLTVELPKELSVGRFLDLFDTVYSDSELLSRRERERSFDSERGMRGELEDALTSRQLETLETAYYSGYFEWPREQTGEEVADALGVTQPTVNRHLRTVQRTLFSNLLNDD